MTLPVSTARPSRATRNVDVVVVIGRTARKVLVRRKGSASKVLVHRTAGMVIVARSQKDKAVIAFLVLIVAQDQKDKASAIAVLVQNVAQDQKVKVV